MQNIHGSCPDTTTHCKMSETTPRMTAMHTAMEQPIILVCILDCLPQKDLLLSQRVCKKWQRLITASTQLQTSLFFTSYPASGSDDEYDFTLNPLLQHHFPSFFEQGSGPNIPVRIEPVYFWKPWKYTAWYNDIIVHDNGRDRICEQCFTDNRFARPEASWRKMVPCHPAPFEYQVYLNTCGYHRNTMGMFQTLTSMPDRPGHAASQQPFLTFGLLYDIIQKALCRSWTLNKTNPLYADQIWSVQSFVLSFGHHQGRRELDAFSTKWDASTASKLEEVIPHRPIGHARSILLCFYVPVFQCTLGDQNDWAAHPTEDEKDAFRSQGSVAEQLRWDAEYVF